MYNMVFIRFVLVGVFCAGIEFLLFNVLITQYQMAYLQANFISLVVAILINYFVSIRMVFKRGMYSSVITFAIFMSVTIVSIGLNQFLVWLLYSRMHLYLDGAKVFAIAFTAVFNFLAKRYVVFKQKV